LNLSGFPGVSLPSAAEVRLKGTTFVPDFSEPIWISNLPELDTLGNYQNNCATCIFRLRKAHFILPYGLAETSMFGFGASSAALRGLQLLPLTPLVLAARHKNVY
jgi:hypothetical protein